jgi:uncharacterized protein YbbC (DUF1343 family)
MTPAELAYMINEEHLLPNKMECSLGFIQCLNYSHKARYKLPVNPSPNLRNMSAVYLYSSLGLFEGTVMNVGRGTDFPFQVFGNPKFTDTTFSYVPDSIVSAGIKPPHYRQVCYGVDLRNIPEEELAGKARVDLSYLRTALDNYPDKDKFFNSFFENLSGNGELRKQLLSGASEDDIRASWQPALNNFKEIRKKYLFYEDFE